MNGYFLCFEFFHLFLKISYWIIFSPIILAFLPSFLYDLLWGIRGCISDEYYLINRVHLIIDTVHNNL